MASVTLDTDQLSLFEDDNDDGISLLFLDERKAAHGVYTCERIEKDEMVYKLIVWCLGQSMSPRKTANWVSEFRPGKLTVSKNTVVAIQQREQLSIGSFKKELSTMLKNFAHMGTERMIDNVDKIPLQQLGVQVAIAIDKFMALDGEPNVRIADVTTPVFNFQEFIESIKSGNSTLPATNVSLQKDADAIEIPGAAPCEKIGEDRTA